MWPVERPQIDAGQTFSTCICRIRDADLKNRLSAILQNVEQAAVDHHTKALVNQLYQIQQIQNVGAVTKDEMVANYDFRMAKKGQPGRPIYDEIKLLPTDDRCPYCDQRLISTLDHFLPKGRYPLFAVTPINLIGSCADCNKLKTETAPASGESTFIHPYYDDVSGEQWLFAEVVETAPAALVFSSRSVEVWSDELNNRVTLQFELLDLARLYGSQAAREITDIRHNLQMHHDAGGEAAVRSELQLQWDSRRANRLNSWQTATYQALSLSDWYCGGGFAAI